MRVVQTVWYRNGDIGNEVWVLIRAIRWHMLSFYHQPIELPLRDAARCTPVTTHGSILGLQSNIMTGILSASACFFYSAAAKLLGPPESNIQASLRMFLRKGSCSFYESGAAEQLAWRYLNANACGCSIGMALAIYDWFLLTTFLHTSGLMISYS